MSLASSHADELLELLCELELDPRQLRRDPRGEGWLPEPARVWLRADPTLVELVLEFSKTESMLFDEARVAPDNFFTARVLRQLPDEQPVRKDLRRRILGFSYLGAAAVAGAALTPSSWFEADTWLSTPWHQWLDAVSVGGIGFGAALAVSAAAVLWVGDSGEPLNA